MGKLFVRISIILVSLYLSISYIIAHFLCIDILRYSYTLLFELCVLIYTFSEGKYHCRFIKWTMLSIFISDCISHLDYYFDFISVSLFNLLLAFILFLGFGYSSYLSIKHFCKVRKLKREYNEFRQ